MGNIEKGFVDSVLSPTEEDYGQCMIGIEPCENGIGMKCCDGRIKYDGEYDGKDYYYCDKCDTEYAECDNCGELIPTDELRDTTEMINGGVGYVCEQCIEDCDMIEIGE